MPLNDDLVLGTLTNLSVYPGDSQEDLNAELLMMHDQKLLLKYVEKRIGRYTLDDLINDLKDTDDTYWEKILKRIIQVYHLDQLKMYVMDDKIMNFKKYVIDLLRDIKIHIQDDILENKFNVNSAREEVETLILNEYTSMLLKWVIRFLPENEYSLFIQRLFVEYRSPMYVEGDD